MGYINYDLKDEILNKLDIDSLTNEIGIQFTGQTSPTFFKACRNPYRPDSHASAGMYMGSCGKYQRGTIFVFNEPGKAVWSVSLFDLVKDFLPGMHGDFKASFRYLAERAGISVKSEDKIVKVYDYVDETGKKVVHQTVRFEPKNFKQRRSDGNGGYVWDLTGIKPVIYRLPEVMKAETVFILEGEKDCDNLTENGLTATTAPMGAGKWRPHYNKHFTGKKVVIIPDNDLPGQAHGENIAQNLSEIATSIKVVKLPNLNEKGDVSDFLGAGHTVADLLKIVEETPPWQPSDQTVAAVDTKKKQLDISDLNAAHAVIMVGGKCLVMNEFEEPIFNRPDISFSSVNDFKNWYRNKKIYSTDDYGNRVVKSLAGEWLDSPLRRQYEGIVFEPNQSSNNYYNLWKGFAIKPKKGNWAIFQDHLYEVVCNGNDDYMEYLLSWMANLVQNPGGERPGVSVVLRGNRGTGKGLFVSNFGHIFGVHFLHITNSKHLTGSFNNHLKNCLLLFADEAFWAGDKSLEGVLKGLITEKIMMIEPKGKDPFMIKNHLHCIMASNNQWVVPAGIEERRFMVLDVSNKRIGDRKYFDSVFDLMDNGGREAMLYDLLNHPINIDLRTAPRTEGLFGQISKSFDSVQSFWFDCLKAETIGNKNDGWPVMMQTNALYDLYVEHAEKIGTRHRDSEAIFGRNLKILCPSIKRRRLTVNENKNYFYLFPFLEECRNVFEQCFGMSVDWGQNE